MTIVWPVVTLVGAAGGVNLPPQLPPSSLDLVLAAPISSWDEAIPLGNGLLGGLLWARVPP